MENLTEILQRDLRTIFRNKKKYHLTHSEDICENCDKDEQIRRKGSSFKAHKRQSSKIPAKSLNCILIVLIFSISTIVSEANPIGNRMETTRQYEIKSCINKVEGYRNVSKSKELENLLRHCNVVIQTSDKSIEEYLRVVFNSNLKEQHDKWDEKGKNVINELPWLIPRSILKKAYNGSIKEEHLNELKNTHWDDKKVAKELEDIFIRLTRIQLGIKVINDWVEMNKGPDTANEEVYNVMQSLFTQTDLDINEAITQITEYFVSKFDNHPCEAQDITSPPVTIPEFQDVKLNHWYVYREYMHVMKYAHELVEIITKYQDKNHKE